MMHCSNVCFLVLKDLGSTWEEQSLAKSHQNSNKTGAPLLWERLRKLGLYNPEKRKLKGDLINGYKYLKGGSKEDRAWFLSAVPRDGIRSTEHKLDHRIFPLNIRLCFTVQITMHWYRLLREVVVHRSPSVKLFKSLSDMVLGKQFKMVLLDQRDKMTSRGL